MNTQYFTERLNYSEIDCLAFELLQAKDAEAVAKNARIAIEEKIIDLVGAKEDGSFSVKTDTYKITTTGKISRKVDFEVYEKICNKILENLRPVEYLPQLSTAKIKYLANDEPELYKIMSECMTITLNKTAVSIEELK